MRKPTVSTVLWMVLALTLPMAAAAEGVRQPPGPIAEMSVSPNRIDWLPTVDAERWVLTFAGPSELFIRREFKAGKAPFLSLFDSEGDRLPDGSYAWELRVMPRIHAGTREELPRARGTGEEDISKVGQPEQLLMQSGSFAIKDGSFVKPSQGAGAGDPKPPLGSITAQDSIETGNMVVKGKVCFGESCSNTDATYSALKLKSSQPNILFDGIELPEGGGGSSHDWALFVNYIADRFSIVDFSNGLIPLSVAAGAPDNSLYVAGDGNVGIGTDSPDNQLHIVCNGAGETCAKVDNSSATGFSGFEFTDETGAALANIAHDNYANIFRFNVINNEPMVFLTNSSERMRVTSAGDIGIGTTSPGTRLDIRGNAAGNAVLNLQNSSATGYSGFEAFDEAGTSIFFVGTDNAANTTRMNSINNHPIVILTNDTERMRVTSAGSIGVGTSSPSSKLHVSGGDIRVSGGSFIDDGVTLNAPDYVFEPSYKLMPLAELREFIAQEKHLPNVPNAREVKEQGLNLSQFQMRLLEKVEELTLYTLSQQEQIGSLHKENSELKKRLEALEGALQQP